MKLHFNTTYDIQKYDGKSSKIKTLAGFSLLKEHSAFTKIAKKPDIHDFMLANFLENEKITIFDLLQDEANDIYIKWKRKNESLSYVIDNDLESFTKENFLVANDSEPKIILDVLAKKINIETFIIFSDISKIYIYYDKFLSDSIFWERLRFKCLKYKTFFEYDKDQFKDKIKNILK